MVQVKSAAVALLLVAPSLALPLQNLDARSQELDARELEYLQDLAARDPRRGGFFRKAAGFAKKFAPKALSIASNFIREEDDTVYAREDVSDILDLSEREIEELEELAARDPRRGGLFRKVAGFAKKFAPKALSIASNFIREEDDGLYTREDLSNILDLSEREIGELEELAARDPRRGGLFRKVAGFAKKFAPKALSIASNFIREEDDSVYAREDVSDILDLSEREIEELEDLAARDPRRGGLFRKVAGFAKKFAPKALSIASNFIREEDDGLYTREDVSNILDLSERDIGELEELAARDPRRGGLFRKVAGFAKKFAPKALSIASNFIREEDDGLYTRENLSDILDLSEREIEELEDLAARDPRRGGLFRKVAGFAKKFAPKALSIASNFIREEDADIDDLLARDYDFDLMD